MHWPLRLALWAALSSTSLAPQQSVEPAEPEIRFSTDLVQVDAVVTDSKGNQVADLRPEDFEISADGKRQAITHFSYFNAGAAVLRTVVFIADTCDSPGAEEAIQSALQYFVKERMKPGDLVSILPSARGNGLWQRLTEAEEDLYAASEQDNLMRVRAGAQCSESSTFWGRRAPDSEPSYLGIASFGAVASAVDGLAGSPGRKRVVLLRNFLGWGRLGANTPAVRVLVDHANRAGAVIHILDPGSFAHARQAPRFNDPFVFTRPEARAESGRRGGADHLARATSGLSFHSTNYVGRVAKDDWDTVTESRMTAYLRENLDAILQAAGGYYLIGYRPIQADLRKGDSKLHTVKVNVRPRGLTVRSRSGYYGALDTLPPAAPRSPEELLRAAVRSPLYVNAIRLRVSPSTRPRR